MNTLITGLLASATTVPQTVPDAGATTGLLLGAAVLGLGMFARFVKNRKR